MKDTVIITDLTSVVKTNNLNGAIANELQSSFTPFFEQAAEWRDKAAAIKVTSLAQTAEMRKAREARLALKEIRVNTEKTRVKLKEDSLRTGKAIDGMANVIKFLVEPIEKHLEDQEKYADRLREQQQAEQREAREIEAGNLIDFFPQTIDLGTISDEEFAKLLHFAQYNAKKDAEERLERERVEREEKEAAELAAMQAENERLKAEAQEREAAMQAERAERERAQQEYEATLQAQRAEADRLRQEVERKEREALAKFQENERAERERLKADADAKKAASEAPDKAKLLRYADHLLQVEIPKIQSEELNKKLDDAKRLIRKAIELITEP